MPRRKGGRVWRCAGTVVALGLLTEGFAGKDNDPVPAGEALTVKTLVDVLKTTRDCIESIKTCKALREMGPPGEEALRALFAGQPTGTVGISVKIDKFVFGSDEPLRYKPVLENTGNTPVWFRPVDLSVAVNAPGESSPFSYGGIRDNDEAAVFHLVPGETYEPETWSLSHRGIDPDLEDDVAYQRSVSGSIGMEPGIHVVLPLYSAFLDTVIPQEKKTNMLVSLANDRLPVTAIDPLLSGSPVQPTLVKVVKPKPRLVCVLPRKGEERRGLPGSLEVTVLKASPSEGVFFEAEIRFEGNCEMTGPRFWAAVLGAGDRPVGHSWKAGFGGEDGDRTIRSFAKGDRFRWKGAVPGPVAPGACRIVVGVRGWGAFDADGHGQEVWSIAAPADLSIGKGE